MKRREFLKLSARRRRRLDHSRLPARRLEPGQGGGEMEGWLQPGTTLEPWRVQFNKDIEAEAKKHPEVELIITDGQDKTEKQVADART